MERQTSKLKDHYIICGCGGVGREVALEFMRTEIPFVIIGRDPEQSEFRRDDSILFLEGSPEKDETLMDAGIEYARGLVAVSKEEEIYVFVVLTARQLNPNLLIIAQAAQASSVIKLERAGADHVISACKIAGRRIASVMLRPSIVDYVDVLTRGLDVTIRMEEVQINAHSPLAGKALRDSGVGSQVGAAILAISGRDGQIKVNDSDSKDLASVVFQEGDVLIALGDDEQLVGLQAFAEGQAQR